MAQTHDEAAQRLAQRCTAELRANDACAALLGIEVVATGPGTATLRMGVREDMLNGQGACHGGILFTLGDAAFGYACNSRNELSVAAAGQIDFVRPARPGDTLRATARERWLSGRTGLYEIEITNAAGEAVAFMQGRAHRTRDRLLPDTGDGA
ncbi:MAG: hydroxyphenylacetyl-CoA thioesterase PaaI [Halofilum sp. (in: g-proteobacteria)]|nr:hydroxyphenylacetyl-CoA thioesterase PaaI [Halofilum sp. (in: g-proteobacteria)]